MPKGIRDGNRGQFFYVTYRIFLTNAHFGQGFLVVRVKELSGNDVEVIFIACFVSSICGGGWACICFG